MTIVQEAHVHREPAGGLEQTSHLFVTVRGGYWRFQDILQCVQVLRLPYRNDAKIAETFNLWTFWPVIQPLSHLFKMLLYFLHLWSIGQKSFLSDFEKMVH